MSKAVRGKDSPEATQPAPPTALRIALMGYRSNPFSGGQGVYIRNVARGLAALGHHVDVISGQPYPLLDEHPRVRLIKLPGLDLFAEQYPLRAFKLQYLTSFTNLFEWLSMNSGGFPEPYTYGRRVYNYLRRHMQHYDIVHDNQTLSPGVLKLQAAGMPLVTTIHHPITFDRDIALANTSGIGLRLLIRRWHNFLNMQTRVAKQLHHIVTVSENSKADISAAFGVDEQRIKVVYNGIDTREFCPQPHIKREAQLLITTASADQPLKGTQHLIPALAAMRQQYPDLKLIFIGKPKTGGSTEALIQQHQLSANIEFVHGVSVSEIVNLYARASIAIVPSEYEGFGLPAAEAMACGVPVVSSNGGALPEVVGDAGIVVDKADPAALAKATLQLLADPQRRAELGAAGRARIERLFSADVAAASLQQYYAQLLRARQQDSARPSTDEVIQLTP